MRLILLILTGLLTASALWANVPDFGYAVSARGFDLPGVSAYEHGSLELLWRPNQGPLTLRGGAALPLGDGWFFRARFTAAAEVRLAALRDHPMENWISLDSRYAPSAGIGGITAEGKQVYLSLELTPLRFETGGGYYAFLAPSLYLDPRKRSLEGWGISLFHFGYYLW